MKNFIKYLSFSVVIAISCDAYTISSGVYKLSSGGDGIEAQKPKNKMAQDKNMKKDDVLENNTQDQQQIEPTNPDNNTPEATFSTGFQPDTYRCVSSKLPKVEGSYFIFYPEPTDCPLVEYRGRDKKLLEDGCYDKKPGRNGADFTNMTLKRSEPHRYEIILVDGSHGKRFTVNHLVDGEFQLFCKAKKQK